jgi:putative alpha-1,2-mannosidase
VGNNFWDTHRSLHPLQLLLDPRRQVDMIRSLLRLYEQSGWLPTVPTIGGDRGVMIGHHGTAFITDAWMKGYRDFDVEEAYAVCAKTPTNSVRHSRARNIEVTLHCSETSIWLAVRDDGGGFDPSLAAKSPISITVCSA